MSFSPVRLTVYAKSLSPIAVLWFMEMHWQRHDVYTSKLRDLSINSATVHQWPPEPRKILVWQSTRICTEKISNIQRWKFWN